MSGNLSLELWLWAEGMGRNQTRLGGVTLQLLGFPDVLWGASVKRPAENLSFGKLSMCLMGQLGQDCIPQPALGRRGNIHGVRNYR